MTHFRSCLEIVFELAFDYFYTEFRRHNRTSLRGPKLLVVHQFLWNSYAIAVQ